VSLATQASLSNLTGCISDAVADEVGWDGVVEEEVDGLGLGWPKNAVMEPLLFGFFAASVARSAALRLRDMMGSLVLSGTLGDEVVYVEVEEKKRVRGRVDDAKRVP